jgi:hypothetical protein
VLSTTRDQSGRGGPWSAQGSAAADAGLNGPARWLWSPPATPLCSTCSGGHYELAVDCPARERVPVTFVALTATICMGPSHPLRRACRNAPQSPDTRIGDVRTGMGMSTAPTLWLLFAAEVRLMVIAWLVFGAILPLLEPPSPRLLRAVRLPRRRGRRAQRPVGRRRLGRGRLSGVLEGVGAVRHFVSQAFASHRGGQVVRAVHGPLAGQEAITLDEVAHSDVIGHPRLAGERWLAISGKGDRIAASRPVCAVRGTTPVVSPVDPAAGSAAEIDSVDRIEASDGADGRTS